MVRAIVVPARAFGNLQFEKRVFGAIFATRIGTDQIPPAFFNSCRVALAKYGAQLKTFFPRARACGWWLPFDQLMVTMS